MCESSRFRVRLFTYVLYLECSHELRAHGSRGVPMPMSVPSRSSRCVLDQNGGQSSSLEERTAGKHVLDKKGGQSRHANEQTAANCQPVR